MTAAILMVGVFGAVCLVLACRTDDRVRRELTQTTVARVHLSTAPRAAVHQPKHRRP